MNRFMDGCGHYLTAQLVGKWDESGGFAVSVVTTAGIPRTGTGCILLDSPASGAPGWVRKLVPAAATYIVGRAWRVVALPAASTFQVLICFENANGQQCTVSIGNDGRLYAHRGSTQLAVGTNSYGAAAWRYLEAKATIADSGGRIIVRVNGNTTPEIDFTGDTQNQTAAEITAIRLGLDGASGSTIFRSTDCDNYVADVYINDTTGSLNNDFLGNVRVPLSLPNGAGSKAEFDRAGSSPPATNWDCVNETTPNDGTDYVETNVANEEDLYAMQDLPAAVTSVFAVAVTPRAQNADAGTRQLAALVRAGTGGGAPSTTGAGTSRTPSTSWSYAGMQTIFETNPATSAAFTPTEANNMECGVRAT